MEETITYSNKVIKEKEFFESYFSLFLQFALKYIPDEETCKDIVQEAFIKYWRQENNFNDEIALKTYLYKSIRNGCLNQLRHENVRKKYFESLPECWGIRRLFHGERDKGRGSEHCTPRN